MKLRAIKPISVPVGTKLQKPTGKKPELLWFEPTRLMVDETYQRDLSRRSSSLLKKVVENFAWNRMKPPICVRAGEVFHVIDGQHTAIAAATLGVEKIPIFVVQADAVSERAKSFVGHNRDRIIITPIDMHRALVAGGDQDALDVDRVCKRAGVTVTMYNQASHPKVGETKSITTIRKVVGRSGVMRGRQVLEALVKAKRAPITESEILAAEYILTKELPQLKVEKLASAIRIDGDRGLVEARGKSIRDGIPYWKAIAERWLRKLK
jgi:hypothetical protein